MNDKIKIDIVSDVVCPWCIIGYKQLSEAISEMDLTDRVTIEWHPFELNPDMEDEGEDLRDHLARKYGLTMPESNSTLVRMAAHGATTGFTFDFFDTMRMVNTRDAHLLLEYAREHGKQTELKLRLFTAFFREHRDVSDRRQLAQEVEAVGLQADEALARLNNDTARKQLISREQQWRKMGVNSVPTMIFNNTGWVTGAQQVPSYKELLENLTTEKQQAINTA